jgi:RNA polymerase sigma factor (sigma-70 family)
MTDDATLLRRYAEEGSEEAFSELVRRHVDLVYGAAFRRTHGDAHAAADIVQQVFTTLARQAGKLSRHTVLSAWLHTATRNATLNLMISEQRRKAREREALDPALAGGGPGPDWDRLRPVLDAAIDELPEPDRAAVVLRFLERRPFGEIGETLQVSSDAARMRTERALDKLRATLARRGITSTAAAVGAIISAQPLMSAPVGLAASVATASLATVGAGAGIATLTVVTLMNLKTIVAGAAVLGAFGIGAYVGLMQQFDAPPPPAPETPRHSQTIADLRKENLALRGEVEQLKAANARLAAPRPMPAAPAPAPRVVTAPATPPAAEAVAVSSRQRATLNNLRQISAARDQFLLEYGRTPSLDELVGPDKYIKRLAAVNGEDYSTVSLIRGQTMTVMTSDGPVSFDERGGQTTRPAPAPPMPPHIAEMQQRLSTAVPAALEAYKAANNGKGPPENEAGARALIPYFTTPQAGADFVEYIEAMKQAGRMPAER